MAPVTLAAEPAVDLPVILRPATTEELRFVQATWARGVRAPRVTQVPGLVEVRAADMRVQLDKSLWLKAHHALVDALLATSKVVVAVEPSLADSPVGWAVWDWPVLHFVHVVPAARRCRVATKLVLHTRATSASHMTQLGRGLSKHLHGNEQEG